VADTVGDGGKPVSLELERTRGSFDFVFVWGQERANDVSLTIDVGVAE
jgi:hypothetical protein